VNSDEDAELRGRGECHAEQAQQHADLRQHQPAAAQAHAGRTAAPLLWSSSGAHRNFSA
jgi:hypothetical protein